MNSVIPVDFHQYFMIFFKPVFYEKYFQHQLKIQRSSNSKCTSLNSPIKHQPILFPRQPNLNVRLNYRKYFVLMLQGNRFFICKSNDRLVS